MAPAVAPFVREVVSSMIEVTTLSAEIAVVLAVLGFTVYLFVSEVVRVDLAALLIMVLLGLLSLVPGLQPIVNVHELFSGFASNAVISIIAVMIIGAGLDRTGIMSRLAGVILRVGGTTERRMVPLISGTVGIISSFMQNVGAAALFLPVVSRISARTGMPMSRLLMPMGFCAILGGTLTMVGSSPVILLNDLILAANEGLHPDHHMQTFGLFSVTPIGLALITTGILYFLFLGRFVLPARRTEGSSATSVMAYFRKLYGLDYALNEGVVPAESSLVDRSLGDVERSHKVRIVGVASGQDLLLAPSRDTVLRAGDTVAVLADPLVFGRFCDELAVRARPDLETFADALASTRAGISEVVIPPRSRLIGRTVRDLWMRKTYGLSVLALHRGSETLREGVRDLPLQAGDTLVCHSAWDRLAHLERDRDFVVVTTEYPHEELRPHKVGFALFFFALAVGLVLFTDLRLSVALLVGAVGMIASGVLSMDEAYQAVSWKTVFLLAGLIPLGLAMETSGTAAWMAHHTLRVLDGVPIWVLQAAIAVLATFFTLVMSNVGATVLLVPLAVDIAVGAGGDPALFALTVALATSNAFLIPTHQVNALIMGPAGYGVGDFVRAGGIMTVLFLVVMLVMLNIAF